MEEANLIQVCSFYKFTRLECGDLAALKDKLFSLLSEQQLRGLIVIAPEGINASIAGTPDSVERAKSGLRVFIDIEGAQFKDNFCQRQPFNRLKVDIRREIITINPGGEPLSPSELFAERREGMLAPEKWHELLTSGEELTLIDVRNDYETKLGKFRGCLDPGLKHFSDFRQFVSESDLPRDRKVLMYCTGGIRCEKAALVMRQQGFGQVYQLEGGILKYLEAYPQGLFDGECFVFDHRVAVDTRLQPSIKYDLCALCGNPASEALACCRCGNEAVLCSGCSTPPKVPACSKNCAYHLKKKFDESFRSVSKGAF
ncbi:MAG: hypothetical protein DCC75_02080 [Proteobacteria bacterium]|nr:MAG: hypothetical protein DCC75_02080 [Pseudomonadota bacterium]